MPKIMVVDDHGLVRTGMKFMLGDIPGISVVGEAANGEDATRKVRELSPDIVLMDIDMPGIGGIGATRKLLRSFPKIKIIILSAYSSPLFSSRLLQRGVSGYLTKDVSKIELTEAIKVINNGGKYISKNVANQLALAHIEGEVHSAFASLTERELQILLMIIRGIDAKNIAKQLHLSPKTISSYRNTIYRKLSVKTDVELTLLASRYGLLDMDSFVLK
jgi:DNA-binding NarL/FixJ family response regulator